MKVKGLSNIQKTLNKVAGRKMLQLKKYSPEILITIGITGIVTSTVMACRATLKVEDILDEAQDDLNDIERVFEGEQGKEESRYSEQDHNRDLAIVYIRTGVKFVKNYGPAFVVGATSVGCLLGAHKIMKNRNLALVAAYKIMEKGFLDYRTRVIEELGEEKDKEFKYGVAEKTLQTTEIDEKGKEVQVKKKIKTADPNGLSPYARFFDASCTQWSKTPEYNVIYVKGQQAWANDMLHARGHIFLNEVYDVLGIPRTQAGNIVGWALKSDSGDNFVDFGIFEARNADFINGYEYSALLDFNVDGVIYDLI